MRDGDECYIDITNLVGQVQQLQKQLFNSGVMLQMQEIEKTSERAVDNNYLVKAAQDIINNYVKGVEDDK